MRKLLFVLAFALASCAVTPETPRESVLACFATVRVAFNTAADVKARGKLAPETERQIVAWGDNATKACDTAFEAIKQNDLTTAQGKLKAAESALLELERWLATQGVKP